MEERLLSYRSIDSIGGCVLPMHWLGLKCCTTRAENGEDVLNRLKRDICVVNIAGEMNGMVVQLWQEKVGKAIDWIVYETQTGGDFVECNGESKYGVLLSDCRDGSRGWMFEELRTLS
ncbi:hypothetical protein C5167_026127 [Papaver somniferum]|uniref:uncharacterized protein LOC113346234 n=1 Tax=Papaver somniferum TaxID=3469 RepID=UPI000E6FC5CA|nr:uncharacterized protein LOC113346234 [Papaver somniferum]RZC94396.1 hypothetical protein C5167_026127 [Papaver somniferum]